MAGLLADLSDPGTDTTLLPYISALIQTNSSYEVALNAVAAGFESVAAADAALDAAQANLAALLKGPSALEVAAAEAAEAHGRGDRQRATAAFRVRTSLARNRAVSAVAAQPGTGR